jgi:nitrogen-specific signal transduction histidine kinase/BarA-like signal transduction histidine kinase
MTLSSKRRRSNTPKSMSGPVSGPVAVDDSFRARVAQEKADLEAQLRQAQKLEALGTLASGMAHDFNNILASIFTYTELAKLDADNAVEVRSHLEEIHKAANRARDLVVQMTAFSAQRRQLYTAVDFTDVAMGALRSLEPRFSDQVDMQISMTASSLQVLGSAPQLEQLVGNIALNAAQAMGDVGGALFVALDEVTFTGSQLTAFPELRAGRYARLVITDTGPGMDADTVKRVFEPFFTTKEPGEGSGLGLAVAHGVVRAHRGALRVKSQPGEGASFTVYLRCVDAPSPSQSTAQHGPVSVAGRRVMLVDDEPAICAASKKYLERLGFRVETFVDPQEALAAYRAAPGDYEVVVTDLSMPGMNGVALAQEMLTISKSARVLLVSGYGGEWSVEQLRALGIEDLLIKPLTPVALAQRIQKMLPLDK